MEVKILNHKLNVASSEDNEEYLTELASYVESVVEEISESKAGKYSEDIILILACLNIADELKRSKNDLDSLNSINNSISKRVLNLIEKIDSIE